MKLSDSAFHREPRYVLRRGLGCWELVFEGRKAVLREEQGLLYVACLLLNPSEAPIHALDLVQRAVALQPRGAGPSPRLLQRSAGLDEAESARALLQRRRRLLALLEDAETEEVLKAEAERELEALEAHQSRNVRRTRDLAQQTVDAVRKAIVRFWCRLAAARDARGQPHPVLNPFAAHLREHLLQASGRANPLRRNLNPGCFAYTPPPGVVWSG